MTEITKRILNLMQERNLNAHKVEVGACLPNASIQSWTKGKIRKDGSITETTPSTESIIKLAKFFNVSADYLLCLTDEPKPLKTSDKEKPNAFAISTKLAQLLEDKDFANFAKLYNALNSEYQKQVYAYILGVATTLGLDIAKILEK